MITESLRSRLVEAGARAWCEANGHFFDSCAWEEQHLVNAGLAFDAMLDCLSEYADEWADAADELDEIEWPPKGMTLERAERMRSNTHLWFLAVLRNPV